jgi:hypothetical protein
VHDFVEYGFRVFVVHGGAEMESGASLDKEGKLQVGSPLEMASMHYQQVVGRIQEWKGVIESDPNRFCELEHTIHEEYRKGADMLAAALLVMVHAVASFDVAAEATRKQYAVPLTRGRVRQIQLRLLGGLVIWIKSLYCEPSRRWFTQSNPEKVPGIYTGLAQCGIAGGVSPALESLIVRKVAGTHSFEFAVDELERQGVSMGYKAIRRVAYECGNGLLTLRKREIERMREGKIISTGELAGCRVVVQSDGGRMKFRYEKTVRAGSEFQVRENAKESESEEDLEHNAKLPEDGGRSKAKKKGRKTYRTEWREPKLVTIFIVDKNGKQVKNSKAWIDGTLQGPDALAEIIAMHLFRLGAGQAESITFVSDGAPWIWDRIDWIVQTAKIPKTVMIHKVLDCCHAVGQMHTALKQFGLSETMLKGLGRLHRKQIREGEWSFVVRSLEKRLLRTAKLSKQAKQLIERSINYLRHHGASGHMDYPKFALMGLPIGSGAIESGIRRVINMRLKSNGMFWLAEHAESILQLRCHYISKRLDERMIAKRVELSRNGKLDWQLEPRQNSPDHSLNTSA